MDYIQPVKAAGNLAGRSLHAGDIENTDDFFRVHNPIKYTSRSVPG